MGSGIIAIVRNKAANVVLVAGEGVALLEFGVASDVFGLDRTTDYGVPWYRLTVCASGGRAVTSDSGLRIAGASGLRALRDADMVIVPPLKAEAPVPELLLRELRRAHRHGARIVALCTGAFVLAAAGLLDRRRATTHWEECGQLAMEYPLVQVDPDVLYVDGGDVLTSAGSAACIDLCLHIVRGDHGAEIAARLARELVVPPFREGGQAQYIESPLPALDPADPFLDVLSWAHSAPPRTTGSCASVCSWPNACWRRPTSRSKGSPRRAGSRPRPTYAHASSTRCVRHRVPTAAPSAAEPN